MDLGKQNNKNYKSMLLNFVKKEALSQKKFEIQKVLSAQSR